MCGSALHILGCLFVVNSIRALVGKPHGGWRSKNSELLPLDFPSIQWLPSLSTAPLLSSLGYKLPLLAPQPHGSSTLAPSPRVAGVVLNTPVICQLGKLRETARA